MNNHEIKIISTSELIKQEFKSKVHVDEKYITIIEQNYFIEKNRCDTPIKILSWILHLSEKIWIDGETIHDFVKAAMNDANIKRIYV